MFHLASGILKDFAKRNGLGDIGFTAVLHTHSRKRTLHPHLHIVIPQGGFDKQHHLWRSGKKGYLFNEMALAKVWCARMLDAINHHPTLSLPKHKLPTNWVVNCCNVGFGDSALKYLSRYLYRGVLPDKDIVSVTPTSVTFRYQDSNTKQMKTCHLLNF